MAPKNATIDEKSRPGSLNAWLKTSHQPSKAQQQKKRPRPGQDAPNCSERPEKVQKSSPAPSNPSSKKDGTSTLPQHSDHDDQTLTLTTRTGDIFSAPPATLLIHACNCQGSWSAGIAAAFKKHYPDAFKVNAKHCRENGGKGLVGTALLIPPSISSSAGDVGVGGKIGAPRIAGKAPPSAPQTAKGGGGSAKQSHFIGCLFTSTHYGKRRDSPKQILEATGPAVRDLLRQVAEWNARCEEGGRERVGEVRMCMINSGLFGVPWEDTAEVLESIRVEGAGGDSDGGGGVSRIEVWERE